MAFVIILKVQESNHKASHRGGFGPRFDELINCSEVTESTTTFYCIFSEIGYFQFCVLDNGLFQFLIRGNKRSLHYMSSQTCFVVMAIGDQEHNGNVIAATDLRKRYDDLIKEALVRAMPSLEVVRADDLTQSGTITTDIITRLMHSTYVVADVTYPNANVFYELGLRHACRPGTFIIRDREGPPVPFDIAHLRIIEYGNTPTGLKELSERLREFLNTSGSDPHRPDSHFLEIARLTRYRFPDYAAPDLSNIETEFFVKALSSPSFLSLFIEASEGKNPDTAEVLKALAANPELAKLFVAGLMHSGQVSLFAKPPAKTVKKKFR